MKTGGSLPSGGWLQVPLRSPGQVENLKRYLHEGRGWLGEPRNPAGLELGCRGGGWFSERDFWGQRCMQKGRTQQYKQNRTSAFHQREFFWVFVMVSSYLPEAKRSFRCCLGGKAMQCCQKDLQDHEGDFGSVCSDSGDSLAKDPDAKPASFASKCLASSGIPHHYSTHVVILFEMITFTLLRYFISLKDMSINTSYSTIWRIMIINSNTSFHD